jgi:hypothetical protein
MALKIHEISLHGGVSGGTWLADRRLWLTDDDKVVEDGDPAAAFLFANKGYPIAIEEAKRRGLVKEKTVAVSAPAPAEKQAPKPRDKQAAKPRDKQPDKQPDEQQAAEEAPSE